MIKTLRLASGQPLLIISAELPLGLSAAEEIRLAKQALVANADDGYAGIAIARKLDRIADADQDLADVIELLSDPNLTLTQRKGYLNLKSKLRREVAEEKGEPKWGDRGHGTVSRQYLDRYLVEAWLYRNARFGPTRHNFDRLQKADTDAAWRKPFLQEIPRSRWRTRYASKRYTLVRYETISLNDGCPVDVIELRNRNGYQVGWCEAFHQTVEQGTIARTILKEFFVWPPFRRRGYGTILGSSQMGMGE